METPILHHYFYSNPETLDLNKMKQECEARQKGSPLHRIAPESSKLHFHGVEDPCNDNCVEYPVEV